MAVQFLLWKRINRVLVPSPSLLIQMNRSVKDLRELICVSRLSYRGEEEDEELHNSNSDEDSLSSHQPFPAPRLPQRKNRELSSLDKDEKLVSPPLSAGSSGRGSPLPPIGKSPITSPNSSSRVSPVECNNRGLPAHSQKPKQTKPNFDDVLMYMDSTVLSEWLRRANDDVKELTSWLHAGDNFVSFAHFFLSEISNSKRRELVQLEFSIITEEVSFSFKAGTDCNQVTARDLDAYLSAILWEYPQQFSESRCAKTFLTILVNLCSGRKDNYRTLLSNVRCSTNNKQFVQQILATRAFAVLSLCSGILKFYKQITQQACNSSLGKDAPSGKDIIELVTDFAFQAVRKGFVDVLQFLLENFKLDPQTMKARDGKSLLFTAVICTQGEVLGFLLKVAEILLYTHVISLP